MSPQQAINIADRDGFCHIGQHTHLLKTCEAAACVNIGDIKTPFILVVGKDWTDFVPVKDAKNKRLIKAIEERK